MNTISYRLEENKLIIRQLLLLTCLLFAVAGSAFAQEKLPTQSQIEGTDVIVKVVDVIDNATAENGFSTPDAGNKFVSVQIVLDNTKGNVPWLISSTAFKLKDSEGNTYDPEEFLGSPGITQPTLKSGEVDGGDLVKGWITFEVGVKVKIHTLKIRYEDSDPVSDNAKSGWMTLAVEDK